MKIIVNNLAVNYEISGSGRAILLLHGWGTDLVTFEALSRELSPRYKVIRLDLPGFGSSQVPSASWNLDSYIEFLEAFLKKLKIKQLYGLVGHSLGGRIALKAVGLKRLQPQKLVLIAAHGIRESRSMRNRLFWLVAKTGKLVSRPLPQRHRASLQKRLYRQAGSADYLEAGAMRQIFSHIVNEDVRPEAAMIGCGALLIYARDDTVTPIKYARIFNSLIPDSKLEVISDGGHFVHQERAPEVNELIRAFLK